jgi:hypothetical protein
MKTFILSENGINKVKQMVIKENNYSEHVSHGTKFLEDNFMKGTYDNGSGNIVGVFIKKSNGMPTKKTVWKQDVLDNLDKEFYNRITNDTERKGFISQLLDDWYNGNISKYGSLSSYNF